MKRSEVKGHHKSNNVMWSCPKINIKVVILEKNILKWHILLMPVDGWLNNYGEPAVLVHYVALIGNHSIVRIIHCRWHCGSLLHNVHIIVIVYDVSIVIVYDLSLLLSMIYRFQTRTGKNWLHRYMGIKLTNRVSPSSGFRVPHCLMIFFFLYRRSNSCICNRPWLAVNYVKYCWN